MRTLRYLRWLFTFTVGAAVLLPSLVLFSVPDTPEYGWSTSAGDVLWLTVLYAPGPALLAWYGFRAIRKAEQGGTGWPDPVVLGGAAVGAVIVSAVLLWDGVTDATSGIIIAIPGVLLAAQTKGALAGAVITVVARKWFGGRL